MAPTASEEVQKREGRKLMKRFLQKIPAVAKLKAWIEELVKKQGWLPGLDGRRLHVRSAHSALNTLLQSAGALCVKMATVLWYFDMLDAGYVWGKDFALVAHVHDELQMLTRPEIAEDCGKRCVAAIKKAGEIFKLNIALDGEYKIGSTWAETH